MSKGFIIAIDGPVAAGKGTVAPLLAKKLNGFYLYTGAMYRCLALLCIEKGISTKDKKQIIKILPFFKMHFNGDGIFLNSKDVTERIKKEDTAMGASDVGLIKEVREKMVNIQQDIARDLVNEGKIVVAEGRDTGTKVFPNAEFKFFLTAQARIRARRRLLQIEDRGDKKEFDDVLRDVISRDEQDSNREIDPLAKDPQGLGYIVLDNSEMSEKETIEKIIRRIKNDKN